MQTQDKRSWIGDLSQTEAEECLYNLRELSGQLNDAMDAIVQRDLPLLNDSLHLQHLSCCRLTDLQARTAERPGRSPETQANALDAGLALEIEEATKSLLTLNNRFSVLLKHSGVTLQLLAGLYRSYRGFARSSAGVQGSLPTWSCEV